MPIATDPFETAQALFRAGNLAQAEQLCRQILGVNPRHGPTLHLLGSMAFQTGQLPLAVQLLSDAIRVDGGQVRYHATLGEVLRVQGQLDQAVSCYRQALRLQPAFAEGHNNLGTLLKALGDTAAAMASFRDALRCRPDYSFAHYNLGVLLQEQGDLPQAAECFARALRFQPNHAEAAVRLGQMRLAAGDAQQAEQYLRIAAQAWPNAWQVLCELGAACQQLGRLAEAIELYRRAAALGGQSPILYYNLGIALRAADQIPEAIANLQAAVDLQPNFVPALLALSSCHVLVVRPDEAVAASRQALAIEPDSVQAAAHLAAGLQMQGELAAAIEAFRRSVQLDPRNAVQHSNLVYTLNFDPAYDAPTLLAEHRAWAAQHAEPLTAQRLPHANDPAADRRLRVGYVSSHFRHHAVSFFAAPLIEAHDRQAVELYLYADVARPDDVTARLRARADHWRDIAGLDDERVATLVREDRIDILVDLAGHIGGNRLLVFARKPAPVQVTYLGYQNTTGMSAMDYRLTDAQADPPGTTDAYYTERLVRLPGPFFCFEPLATAPPVNPLPATANGYVTFASLNHINKLTPEAIETWAEIVAATPGSRLVVLAYAPGQLEERIRAVMARAGIDASRVSVVNKRPRDEYLALHHHIDMALDTFPFQGHTTVCDALWMGVPSIMLEGDSYASRFGGSTLKALGLDELIAPSREQYVARAVALAHDLPRLQALRATLRDRMAASPLLDAPGFARQVEAAYRQMWRTWCQTTLAR